LRFSIVVPSFALLARLSLFRLVCAFHDIAGRNPDQTLQVLIVVGELCFIPRAVALEFIGEDGWISRLRISWSFAFSLFR